MSVGIISQNSVILGIKIEIRILYDYLSEFERIRVGDCERPLMKPT
jgi:hypothetical protein